MSLHLASFFSGVGGIDCAFLQGFPDGWTEEQADSPRYRQMGNAVAVPVFEWVARRLMVEDSLRDRKAAS